MKKLIRLTALFVVMAISHSFAQEVEIPNVLSLRNTRQSGIIKEQNEITGYYTFYFKEKADKKNSTYEIKIVDNELNEVNTFDFTRPKNTLLMESVYNGEALMFFFWDRKTGYEFATYDLDGNKIGESKIAKGDISSFDIQKSTQGTTQNSDNITLYPVQGEGFIRQTFTRNKKMAFELVRYSNEAKEEWTYSSPEDSKLVETVEINEVTDKYVTATIYRKKSLMTKKMNLAFLILDAKTGKKIAELPMGDEDEGKKSVLKSFFDVEKNKFILLGEYYKAGDDILKDKSQGMFSMDVSPEGKITSETQYNWKKDIATFMDANLDEEDKKDDRPYNLFFHDVIRAKNGHLFLVAEQYKKQISATAVAGKMLAAAAGGSSDASSLEILVANMVVIELDESNALVDIDIIQKRKRHVLLPQGYGLSSVAYLGFYVNSIGEFDYSFTSRQADSDKFTVVYTDANRKEEKGQKKSDVLVGIIHVENGEAKTDRIGINFDSRFFWLREAKPGYLLVGEYFRKEKSIKFRLEQLAY